MRPTSLVQLACWADGRLVRDDGAVRIDRVSTDTRTLSPTPHSGPAKHAGRSEAARANGSQALLPLPQAGEGLLPPSPMHGREGAADAGILFIALKGEHFDGHDHIADASKRGAHAALVAREIEVNLPQIVVDDTAHALARLAAKMQSIRTSKILGITGSNGKTTVKQFTIAILAHVGKTCCNPGNLNNEIGLPLAVIDAPEDARFAVYEMGAGQPGDIAYLTEVAKPQIALVNNIAPAHLERMLSLLGIAKTKAAIYDALPDDGIAIINADDAFAEFFAARVSGKNILRFGLDASADIRAREIAHDANGTRFMLITPEGETNIVLPLPGRHNVRNALAAAALALAAGAPLSAIAAGLSEAQAVPGRMCRHTLPGAAVLIDDSYNANPGSLSAAIEVLASAPPGWLILGDMRELGDEAESLHAAAGEKAHKAGIAKLFALGQSSAAAAEAFGENAQRFETHEALIAALYTELARSHTPPPTLLVKGSRGSRMERVVEALLNAEGARDAA